MRLDRRRAFFAGTDPDHILHRSDEYLPIPDPAGPKGSLLRFMAYSDQRHLTDGFFPSFIGTNPDTLD